MWPWPSGAPGPSCRCRGELFRVAAIEWRSNGRQPSCFVSPPHVVACRPRQGENSTARRVSSGVGSAGGVAPLLGLATSRPPSVPGPERASSRWTGCTSSSAARGRRPRGRSPPHRADGPREQTAVSAHSRRKPCDAGPSADERIQGGRFADYRSVPTPTAPAPLRPAAGAVAPRRALSSRHASIYPLTTRPRPNAARLWPCFRRLPAPIRMLGVIADLI